MTVAVICDAAIGAMQLAWMLYFSPSRASVLVNAVIAIFAELHCQRFCAGHRHARVVGLTEVALRASVELARIFDGRRDQPPTPC